MSLDRKTVFFISQKGVEQGSPKTLLGVPFIIDEDGCWEPGINEYLMARRNGDWGGREAPNGQLAEAHGVRTLRASLLYLKNRAYQLDSFRRWCRSEDIDPVQATEQQIDQYASVLESSDGKKEGLKPSSVNQHLESIIDFLNFSRFLMRLWAL